MKVYDLQVKAFDKDGSMLLQVRTDRGNVSFWGKITSSGKILDEEGRVLFRIKPELAQRLREKAKGKLQYTYAVVKQELEEM